MENGRLVYRDELVKDVQAALDLPSKVAAAEALVKFENILWKRLVVNGERVKLGKIGTLRKEVRPAHESRVPNSDRIVQVPERYGFKLASVSYEAV